jgi:type II secretory pathway pseudopilin PulG
MKNKIGQIWIETVIYTLIGLALIGLVLAIATPKINELRDRAVVEQSIDSLNIFDRKINEILSAPGNVRIVEFEMRRGDLFFNTTEDKILYVLDESRVIFSEPGVSIPIGRINVTTTEGSKRHMVSLLLSYNHNLTFNGEDSAEATKFSATAVPYRFSIANKGFQEAGRLIIDISEVSS